MSAEVATESAKIAGWLESVVLKRIADDQLVLPSIPGVVAKSLEIVRKTDFNFKDVATVIEMDPVLTARALRLATSAAFSGGTMKLSLAEALARIGAKSVKTLLIEGAAQKLFVSKNPQIAGASRRTWEHSIVVAGMARDIAALAGSQSGEAAYLGGLLHDVGKPLVATMLLEAERQVVEVRNQKWIDSPVWLEVMARLHRKVGVALAEKWQLPEEVCRCIRDCSEYDNSDRASIVNAVCLANALAKQNGFAVGPVDADDIGALVMIGRSLLGLSQEMLAKLSSDLKDRVNGMFE